MLKEFVQYLLAETIPTEFEVDDRKYMSREVKGMKPPLPVAMKFRTLSGFCEFAEDFDKERCLVHVVDHQTVELVANDTDNWEQRPDFATATTAGQYSQFRFGEYMDPEAFIIALQTLFKKDPHRDAIIAILANISSEQAVTNTDDGMTQTVGQKAGVVLKSKTDLPNPLVLRPFRTFNEIDQPDSPFILRVQQGRTLPQCSLWEADGGVWKLEAMNSISTFLKAKLEGWQVLT